jgi:hypothetical protein
VHVDREQFFECLKCGHFTKFDPGNRARCESCGCTTGIMVNDTASPLFRFSPQRIVKALAPGAPVGYGTEKL